MVAAAHAVMGNSASQADNYPVTREEMQLGPHNFYLVFGKPSIRYRHDRLRGPLIYDVNIEYDEDADAVEHTASLELPCAVPRRQAFDLKLLPTPAATNGSDVVHGSSSISNHNNNNSNSRSISAKGLALTFRVAATAPPRAVRVLADVEVRYCPGVGLELVAKQHPTAQGAGGRSRDARSPRTIFSTDATASLSEDVVTRAEVFLSQIQPVEWETPASTSTTPAAPRVTYAPLVIEVDVGVTEAPTMRSDHTTTNNRNTGNAHGGTSGVLRSASASVSSVDTARSDVAPTRPQEEGEHPHHTSDAAVFSSSSSSCSTSDAAAATTAAVITTTTPITTGDAPSSPPPQSLRKPIKQYTFLEVPSDAIDAWTNAALADVEGADALRLHCKVAAQLLQVGSEVYSLEDVFDIDREDEGAPAASEAEEVEGLCAVCLMNPKDTTILPCRHMCLCSECAAQLRLSYNRCPMCRGNIERLMTM